MNKLFRFKILSICIIASSLGNLSFQTVSAEEIPGVLPEWDIIASDEQDVNQYNEYMESKFHIIIKYMNEDGEKIDSENKIYISQSMEAVIVDPDTDLDQYMSELKAGNANIEYVQPDYQLILSNTDENEAASELINISENYGTMEAGAIQQENVQTEDVIVAVIDSGIDISHEAIADHIWVNDKEANDGADDDENGYIDDISGWDFINNESLKYDESQFVDYNHGTHVASIISGHSDKIQGICEAAKIMPLKAFKDGSAYTSDIIRAINYADSMGADIVNCSFGSNDENRALKETIAASDMLFICAAGNKAKNIDESPVYPASYDIENVISVAASDTHNQLAYFSNYGESVDIAAPGLSIYSSLAENEYGYLSGTSMAAAYISGVAASIAASDKNVSAIEIKEQLLSGVEGEIKAATEECYIKSLDYSVNSISDDTAETMDLTSVDNAFTVSSNQINQIGAGGYHSVVLVDDRVYAFGCNDHNQCSGMYYFGAGDFSAPGNELFVLRYSPYGTADTDSIKKISTKGDHTLFLMADGTVRAMGANAYGQLGIGYVGGENITDAYEPTDQVTGLSNIVDIAAGHQFSLALDSSGRVYAWGNNKDGQLGIANAYGFFYAPQRISGITNVTSISAGYYHALAIIQNNSVYGWGRAYNGALGDLPNDKYYSPQMLNVEDVDKVVAGLDNSFFIKSDKSVYAYGYNAYGQLGDGTTDKRNELMPLPIDDVADISTGFSTVFLKEDGTAYGCGLNAYGQLGIGTSDNTVKSIKKIPGTYDAVSVGGNHTLFLKDREVYSAGRNQKSQCGFTDKTACYLTPTLIPSYAKDSFTIDNITVDYNTNEIVLSGKCVFGDIDARIYAGNDYRFPSSNYNSVGVYITPVDDTYTVRYKLNSPQKGTNYGWIRLVGYPYKFYFIFDYKPHITSEWDFSVKMKQSNIFAVTVTEMENIETKVFTVDFDSTQISLDDACVQTWKKNTEVGAVADTDIEIIAVSDSQIKFKVNKLQSPISGTVNMLRFNGLIDGTTTLTVTVE